MAAVTRLGLSAIPRALYGSFSGKTEDVAATPTPRALKAFGRIKYPKSVGRIASIKTIGYIE